MPPPESLALSQLFQGKDNLCPRVPTAPYTTHPLKDAFQGAQQKDISFPCCPAPQMTTKNTFGRRKHNYHSFPHPFSFGFGVFFFFFFKSHSLAETALSHFHDPPCPWAGVDGCREQCSFEAPGECRGGDWC